MTQAPQLKTELLHSHESLRLEKQKYKQGVLENPEDGHCRNGLVFVVTV